MSNLITALSWLKNGNVQLLFFAICPSSTLKTMFEGNKNLLVFDYSSESEFPVLLIEEWLPAKDGVCWQDVRAAIGGRLSQMMGAGALAVICMFDGSYETEKDLIDSKNHASIYAFAYGSNVSISNGDRYSSSPGWRDSVVAAQKFVSDNL